LHQSHERKPLQKSPNSHRMLLRQQAHVLEDSLLQCVEVRLLLHTLSRSPPAAVRTHAFPLSALHASLSLSTYQKNNDKKNRIRAP
jgi:hypothetical protein